MNNAGTSSYSDIEQMLLWLHRISRAGMTRETLLKNFEVVQQVGEGIRDHAPKSWSLAAFHMQKVTGFPTNRVIGQAGVLDSARMAHFSHGEQWRKVLSLWYWRTWRYNGPSSRYTTVGGIPTFSEERIISRTRLEAENSKITGGSAFYAPGSAAAIMAESVLNDRRRLIPMYSSNWAIWFG